MSDLEKYIEKRKQTNPEFADQFEAGYLSFKIGVMLAQAREEAGLTKEDLANQLNLSQLMIDNLENNVENLTIAILERYAKVLGKELIVEFR